jgi:hypothetical protein
LPERKTPVRKPFEQELHDQFDAPAKEAVANFIERKAEVVVYPNPDKYGVDLIVANDAEELGAIEVEVRQWSPNCPYPTIHVPERKTKYFNDKTLFFALTRDMLHAYWIQTNEIPKYPLKEIRNVKVAEGELFYDVPTTRFAYVDLKEE